MLGLPDYNAACSRNHNSAATSFPKSDEILMGGGEFSEVSIHSFCHWELYELTFYNYYGRILRCAWK